SLFFGDAATVAVGLDPDQGDGGSVEFDAAHHVGGDFAGCAGQIPAVTALALQVHVQQPVRCLYGHLLQRRVDPGQGSQFGLQRGGEGVGGGLTVGDGEVERLDHDTTLGSVGSSPAGVVRMDVA